MKTFVGIHLNPEISKRFANKKTAHLTDAEVDRIMKLILPEIKKLFADVQLRYKAGAQAEYDKSGTHELFASDFNSMIAVLTASLDSLTDAKAMTLAAPDEHECQTIAKLLSAKTILCYPCFELSNLLTSREILTYFAPFARKPSLTEKDIDAMRCNLVRSDIFCLRDATPEHALQNALVGKLEECCLAGARTMKKFKAREEAMRWLDINAALNARNDRYDLALPSAAASAVMADFKTAFTRNMRVRAYESL